MPSFAVRLAPSINASSDEVLKWRRRGHRRGLLVHRVPSAGREAGIVQLRTPRTWAYDDAARAAALFDELVGPAGVDFARAGDVLPRAVGTYAPTAAHVRLARANIGIEPYDP